MHEGVELTDLFAECVAQVSGSTEQQAEDSISSGAVASGQLQQDVGGVLQTLLGARVRGQHLDTQRSRMQIRDPPVTLLND